MPQNPFDGEVHFEPGMPPQVFLKPKVTRPKKEFFKLLMVGADVEMFLKDKQGKPVPCVSVVGGTKTEPLPLPGLPDGFARQEDNVMLEFNIAPAPSAATFVNHIGMALSSISGLLEPKGLNFDITPAMRFDLSQLQSEQAQHIGCEPDFNVWERKVNEINGFPKGFENLRTSGGHVHVSFLLDGKVPHFPEDMEQMECVVMAMDIFLGIPMIRVEPKNERRSLYGKAGAFRHKPYGIEYRTLSNFWISQPALTKYVFEAVEKSFAYLNLRHDGNLNRNLRHYKEKVEDCINNNSGPQQAYMIQAFGTGAASA